MTERIYKTKAECEALGWLDMPTLRAMRLKPAKSQQPANVYWQGHGEVYVYAVAACVPMAPYRAPTPAQLTALAAGRLLLGTVKCVGCGDRIDVDERSDLCRDCINSMRLAERDLSALPEMLTVYLDTETTGLRGRFGDEIVELCICNDLGEVLINTLVRPSAKTEWPDAQEIHGIDPTEVIGAPTLADLMPAVLNAIRGKRVVIYNSAFDTVFFPAGTFDSSEVQCCMLRFAKFLGEWNDYFNNWRWHKLTEAAEHVGYDLTGSAHRALPDVLATRSVWHWLQAGAPARPAPEADDDSIPF